MRSGVLSRLWRSVKKAQTCTTRANVSLICRWRITQKFKNYRKTFNLTGNDNKPFQRRIFVSCTVLNPNNLIHPPTKGHLSPQANLKSNSIVFGLNFYRNQGICGQMHPTGSVRLTRGWTTRCPLLTPKDWNGRSANVSEFSTNLSSLVLKIFEMF